MAPRRELSAAAPTVARRGRPRLLAVAVLFVPAAGIAAIYFLSSIPASGLPSPPVAIPHLDKGVHALLYARLLSTFRLWRGRGLPVGGWLPGAIGGSVIAALGDEWHQGEVPGRSPDPLDLVADIAGIALASLLWARSSRPVPPS